MRMNMLPPKVCYAQSQQRQGSLSMRHSWTAIPDADPVTRVIRGTGELMLGMSVTRKWPDPSGITLSLLRDEVLWRHEDPENSEDLSCCQTKRHLVSSKK